MAADLSEPLAQGGHVTDKVDEIVAIAPEAFPADPAGLIVLAVGIVVAVLRVADLVAGEEQR